MMLKFKIILILILFIGCLTLGYWQRESIKNAFYRLRFEPHTYSSESYNLSLNYRLFTPRIEANEKLPIIVSLHPWGQNGSDNKGQVSGLAACWTRAKLQSEYPCYVIVPQCPAGMEWAEKGEMSMPFTHYQQDKWEEVQELILTMEVVDELIDSGLVDASRIYSVGYSMGGTGAWDLITRHPERFAAAVIASGVSDTSKAKNLVDVPVWAFGGENDNVAPVSLNKTMVEKINMHGGDSKITIFKGEGHGIGYKSFVYPGVVEWLFKQKKDL